MLADKIGLLHALGYVGILVAISFFLAPAAAEAKKNPDMTPTSSTPKN